MNKDINNIYQCSQCKKDFSGSDVYRIGIKQKNFYCRECAKNIKSECMWCGKELTQKKWSISGGSGSGIKSEEGQLTETIDRDNHSGEKHNKYYLACEETREHGIRPNQSCPSRINDWWVEKGNQRRREKANRGWKKCEGKALYLKDPKTGKVFYDAKCWKLVPPGEKHCKDEMCIYFTEVYNGAVSEKAKKIKQRWDQCNQEKYQRANEWWNSLSLAEKQVKLKAEEVKLRNLGLQRQRCWIERLDKNSILFKNGKLHYDNMDKIPPSFLHDWGYPGYQWESVWKNDSNHSNTAFHKVEIDKEINGKNFSLQQAKENGENELVAQLEKQIQELKSQQQGNSTSENPVKNKSNVITYSIVGLMLVALVGIVILLVRARAKNPKIKQ